MAHMTLKLTKVNPKKHVVRFDVEDDKIEESLITNVYVSRELAEEHLGIKKLDKIKGIEQMTTCRKKSEFSALRLSKSLVITHVNRQHTSCAPGI